MSNIKIIFILSFTVLYTTSCNPKKQNEAITEEETPSNTIVVEKLQFSSSNFELGTITEQVFSNTLNVAGRIHLPEKSKAVVSSLMEGTVGKMDLVEGQWVSQGSTLFTITNPELINMQEDYLVLQGQLDYLGEEYNRQIKLSKENITTQKELLKAKSELNTCLARYNGLKKKLNLYGINTAHLTNETLLSSIAVTAPTSGYISGIHILRGAFLSTNESALQIANTNHMHLELSVLERDASYLKKDQEVQFAIQGDPNKVYKAKIHLINKMIDENHMISIHCHMEDEDSKSMMPGMFVQAKIVLDNQKIMALPKDAIVKLGDKNYVLKLINKDNDKYEFERINVENGIINSKFVSVENLSKDGAEYLTKGTYFLIQ